MNCYFKDVLDHFQKWKCLCTKSTDSIKVERGKGGRTWCCYLGFKHQTSVTVMWLSGESPSIWKSCQLFVNLFSDMFHPPPRPRPPPPPSLPHFVMLAWINKPQNMYLYTGIRFSFTEFVTMKLKKCLQMCLQSHLLSFSTKMSFHINPSGHLPHWWNCYVIKLD